MIYNSVKHLKSHNENLRHEQKSNPYVFVSDHLPQKLLEQRKQLLSMFNEARKRRQKTLWKVVDGEYCLYVDEKKIEQ